MIWLVYPYYKTFGFIIYLFFLNIDYIVMKHFMLICAVCRAIGKLPSSWSTCTSTNWLKEVFLGQDIGTQLLMVIYFFDKADNMSLSPLTQNMFLHINSPYIPADDNEVDPDCSRHGYTLHIVLHNPVRQIMCQRFSPLYTRRGKYITFL